MQSLLVNAGNRMRLEITLPTTGIDRDEAATVALISHGLTPGQVEIVFANPSTEDWT